MPARETKLDVEGLATLDRRRALEADTRHGQIDRAHGGAERTGRGAGFKDPGLKLAGESCFSAAVGRHPFRVSKFGAAQQPEGAFDSVNLSLERGALRVPGGQHIPGRDELGAALE